MPEQRRYCITCDAETLVKRTRGNNGVIEFCPGCSFPFDFGGVDE